jgi:hypothetical protein
MIKNVVPAARTATFIQAQGSELLGMRFSVIVASAKAKLKYARRFSLLLAPSFASTGCPLAGCLPGNFDAMTELKHGRKGSGSPSPAAVWKRDYLLITAEPWLSACFNDACHPFLESPPRSLMRCGVSTSP